MATYLWLLIYTYLFILTSASEIGTVQIDISQTIPHSSILKNKVQVYIMCTTYKLSKLIAKEFTGYTKLHTLNIDKCPLYDNIDDTAFDLL